MDKQLTFLLVLLSLSYIYGSMYDITIESFEPDPEIDDSYFKLGTLRVTRKKRNSFSLTGNFETFHNWGNDIVVTYDVRGQNGNGPVLMRGKYNFCEFYNLDMDLLKAVFAASNMPPQGTCPMPKGKYEINGFELQEKDLPMVIPKDKYVVGTQLTTPEGKLVVGYKVRITVS